MSKRRVEEDSDIEVSSTDSEDEIETGQNDALEEQEEMVNVDFDYFDLNPDVDFHSTKNLLRQLLGDDNKNFDISSLADLILTKDSVGTTIKTEGQESDPFALLSVINLNENMSKPSIKTLIDYIFNKTNRDREFNMFLRKVLGKDSMGNPKSPKIGLIVSERLINMPVEIVPPMYKMLLEEIEKADDANEKYQFDYFLIISKVYQLVTSSLETESTKVSKKKKLPTDEPPQVEMDYFHYEDMIFESKSKYRGVYPYSSTPQETDSRRVFTQYGIDPKLSLMLISKQQLAESVPEMEAKFPPF